MGFWDDLIIGRYLPSTSALHRLDARYKVVMCLGLIVLSFAVRQPWFLGCLGLLLVCLYFLVAVPWQLVWRGWWALRWLFLFTLLLHVLLTPGRTVPGVAWLSLDGLQHGLIVDVQVSLALLFSSLLTLTTPPGAIAAACGSLLRPLAWLRVPVDQGVVLIEQVLEFIPLVQGEVRDALLAGGEFAATSRPKGLLAQGRQLRRMIGPLILRLADLAEERAQSMAKENQDGAGDLLNVRKSECDVH